MKLTEEQRLLKQAQESLEQAKRILTDEPDSAAQMQNIRNAATQATQAANDLNILYGFLLYSLKLKERAVFGRRFQLRDAFYL